MNILWVGRVLGVLLYGTLIVSAGGSPQIIAEPGSTYSFSSSVYYADCTASNATIKVVIYPGNPSWTGGGVRCFTRDGTALAGNDYTAMAGEVAINGPLGGTFNVPLHPSASPVDKTVLLGLTTINTNDLLRIGGATLVIRAAPLALALPLPLIPLTFKLNACIQGRKLDLISTRTNQTRVATNITRITKSTLNNIAFGDADMLALLENSFHTNLPSGSQIGLVSNHLYVVDSTGTNIVLDPGAVVSFKSGEQFVSGLQTQINNQENTVPASSGNNTEAVTSRATFGYDDSVMTPLDGTFSRFDFSGLCIMKVSTDLKTLFSRVSVNFEGVGDGTIRNQQIILTGAISGNINSIP